MQIAELAKLVDEAGGSIGFSLSYIVFGIILISFIGYLGNHIIKIFNKSVFDRCFQSKDEIVWHRILYFVSVFGLFNLVYFTWSWMVSLQIDTENLPYILLLLFNIVIWVFIGTSVVVLVAVILRYIQKWMKIKLSKSRVFYMTIFYAGLISTYLFFLALLITYFDTRNTADSYPKFLGELALFVLFSLLAFLFYGSYLLNHFGLNPSRSISVILKRQGIDGTYYVLHAVDKNRLVLGDQPTEAKSKKLHLYNLERDSLHEFQIEVTDHEESQKKPEGDLPSRKQKHT